MTIAAVRPAAHPGPATARPESERDGAVDAARAFCLVVVLALHALMVGVSLDASGPVLGNALDGWAGLAPLTWFAQVMPLFFVIGGFAGRRGWQRMRSRGGTAGDFVRGRLARLVRPAVALVGFVGLGLAALSVAGVPADIVATAGFRIGQPLWFLAVYLGATALVPAMSRLHERRPLTVVAALAALALAVDGLRAATGITAFGLLNLAFVWLLVQQFGFFLADGRLERHSRRVRALALLAALGMLASLIVLGGYSPDLLENLNPPTFALVPLGVAQLLAFSLVRPALGRWAARPGPARLVARFGEQGMTLYLWHLTAYVLLAGVLLLGAQAGAIGLPAPQTAEWWLSRPVWLLAAIALAVLLARATARFERGGRIVPQSWAGRRMTRAGVPVGVAVPAGILGVVVVLVHGFGPLPALVSAGLLLVALAGSSKPGPQVSGAGIEDDRAGSPARAARGLASGDERRS
ncbi:acyltransferase family protein [Agromyces seonyuensis]|uniref:Acyltransferase family protein n=1 Tax=Agromyces seonyuensis TaxID=2662446 RepID=A0A6I4NTP3_9MICO|nr:acyltransferase [Agromyces seonyuensis]MWB97640.1 acyltransferase family protein [Agromyces seonyuensis]